ncbi:MAG TPA: 4a-hydroxytetrahydrobiopterin dehydratase [Gaiellaceae bacterium]|nr:4a-hydroxytetrahydrobiopterin dehydratase [Gaiellaceae bacterium]
MTPEGWTEVDDALERTFELENFVDALAFVNRVGELAEAEGHHPDVAIHYNRVTLRWWTHTAGGVTDRDRELAEKSGRL